LLAEMRLILPPEEPDCFGTFCEREHAAPHVLRGKDFEEVPIGVFGDFHDAPGDADTANEVGPLFGRGTGNRFHLLDVREDLAKR
jgi:hypothetical protein